MSSASDYMVGNAPQGASYAAPLVGQQLGQTIAGYPDAYMKGTQNRRTLELQKPIVGPDGQPTTDYQTIAQELLRRGGGEYAEKMLPFLYGAQADQGITNVAMGMPPGASNTGPGATANATGPANLRPQPQSSPPQAAPQSAPQGAPQGQPQPTGADGQDTLRSIATEVSGGKDITPIIGTAARVMRMNPDAPLSPQDIARVKTFIGNAVRGGPQVAAGTPQAPQPPQAGQAAPQATGQPAGVENPQADDPTLGGLIPANWAAQGRTPSQYRDVLTAVASRMGVSPNAKDAALARVKAIDDYMAKTSQTGYEAELKASAPMKEAKAAGFKSVQEYQAAQEAAKEEAKGQVSTLKDLSDAGIEAKGQMGQLQVIQQLGDKVKFGAIPKLQSMLGKYGVDTNGLTDIQAYERAIDYMAPQLRPIGSGRLMQQELNAFKAALGGLMTTPEGRRISVENLGLIAKYKSKIGAIASDSTLNPQQRIERIYSVEPPHLKTQAPQSSQGGTPQQAQANQPPVQGARSAPDGKWYVSDPSRPGKYLEVRP